MFLPAAEDNRGCSDGLAGRLPPEREKEREREEQRARERERKRERESRVLCHQPAADENKVGLKLAPRKMA